ncbi:hypothetical protein [Aeromicrobium fastidiosum]|uniref:Uncharacterized protein n=1 Tax=Aeromicrobium fastidiosum TaxID=52699 RepID=A0A641ASK5_9ACTN|nr:hypothetical protein [Aeromicrobium fastidiosum]KAA1379868.1 hypothetical protein ESP62_001255 [Aeromicrobium fastidiosum]MBP2389371.1 hypothetical protein [Aeromicrobium fastidiosum]
MTVKVTVRHQSPAGSEVSDRYEKGRGIFLDSGHLVVGDNPARQHADTLAIYAPGKWENAEIVEASPQG